MGKSEEFREIFEMLGKIVSSNGDDVPENSFRVMDDDELLDYMKDNSPIPNLKPGDKLILKLSREDGNKVFEKSKGRVFTVYRVIPHPVIDKDGGPVSNEDFTCWCFNRIGEPKEYSFSSADFVRLL